MRKQKGLALFLGVALTAAICTTGSAEATKGDHLSHHAFGHHIAKTTTLMETGLPFSDIKEDDWFYPAVQHMYRKAIMHGTDETHFSPDASMTRGMFITVLGRMDEVDITKWADHTFLDVDHGQYYAPYVNWAVKNQIVSGVSADSFAPEAPITREAMVKILTAYAAYRGVSLPAVAAPEVFADEADFSAWVSLEDVYRMLDSGILNGIKTQDGRFFLPQNCATRADVAIMLMRFDQYISSSFGDSIEVLQDFFDALVNKQYSVCASFFSPDAAASLEEMGGLSAYISLITAQSGEFSAVGDMQFLGTNTDSYPVYTVTVEADNMFITFTVVLDETNHIAGLQAAPLEKPIQMPEGYIEEAVTVDAGTGYPLEGYIVRPKDTKNTVPAVVLVQGSGATNYDEIISANRVFGQIARGLAKQGIATIRYDKRNYAYPDIAEDAAYSVQEEYIEDVVAATKLLAATAGITKDEIYILGHSQGGMLAPAFLDAGAPAKGMILFAGTPRNLLDIMDDQQEAMLSIYAQQGMTDVVDVYREMQVIWKAERKALDAMTLEEAKGAGTVYGMGAYYIKHLGMLDAIATIKKLQKPTLILQGDNDYQVYADKDFKIYEDELKNEKYVSSKLYAGLNHLFMPSKATNILEAVDEYNIVNEIPEQVFQDVAAWISQQQ